MATYSTPLNTVSRPKPKQSPKLGDFIEIEGIGGVWEVTEVTLPTLRVEQDYQEIVVHTDTIKPASKEAIASYKERELQASLKEVIYKYKEVQEDLDELGQLIEHLQQQIQQKGR